MPFDEQRGSELSERRSSTDESRIATTVSGQNRCGRHVATMHEICFRSPEASGRGSQSASQAATGTTTDRTSSTAACSSTRTPGRSYRLRAYPRYAWQATPRQQITVAERVLARSGLGRVAGLQCRARAALAGIRGGTSRADVARVPPSATIRELPARRGRRHRARPEAVLVPARTDDPHTLERSCAA